jgi:uncharacterized membrane protein YdjX (TVP38/TMEM64 family)
MALTGKGIGRAILAAAILAGVLYTWLHRDLFQHGHLQAFIIENRAWIAENPYAPLLFILVHVVVSLTFIPRSLIAVAAGVIWGVWWGSLLAALGCLAGAAAGFLIARYLNDGLIRPSRLPGFGRFMERLERGGWRAVAMLRLVPVMPHTPVNYAFGLTSIGFVPYCLGTVLGSLPTTVFYADLGAVGETTMTMTNHGQWYAPAAIGLAAIAASFLLPRLPGLRSRKD